MLPSITGRKEPLQAHSAVPGSPPHRVLAGKVVLHLREEKHLSAKALPVIIGVLTRLPQHDLVDRGRQKNIDTHNPDTYISSDPTSEPAI